MESSRQLRETIRPFAPLTPTERLRIFTAQPFVRLCIGAVIVALFAGYFFTRQNSASTPKAVTTNTVTTLASTSSSLASMNFKVYVTGEVNAPGVVDVDSKARIADAIDKAGGLTNNADVLHCDMAAFVADGTTIRVPTKNQQTASTCGANAAQPATQSPGGSAPQGKINLNTATQSEIETLPGVGPTLGAAIIAYRTQHGSFSSVADLQKVKGIGDGRFADLKDLVTT